MLLQEEMFWRQKSRLKWLKEGDRNTKFFHAYALSQQRRCSIPELHCEDGSIVSGQSAIADMFVSHFSAALTSSTHCIHPEVLASIPLLLQDKHNSMLCAIPSFEEIKRIVFSMSPDSTPGPDGLTGHFFHACWQFIEHDVCLTVQAYFCGHPLPQVLSSSLIALIPKVDAPKTCADYRPISLCNFFYKIISRVLSDRLVSILPILISEEQGAFVKGRYIIENVSLACELVQYLGKNCKGRNVIFKLDMAKAYDRLEWNFLYAVLRHFGFSMAFTSLLEPLLSNC